MKIGIFGFGAVGCALFNELKDYDDLYILLDDNRFNKYKNNPVIINDIKYIPNYINNGIMDLIIVSVKNYDLLNALKDLSKFVDDNTIILPVLNGIRAHDILKSYFKNNIILYGVINVEANKINNVAKVNKINNLQYGFEYNDEIKYPLNIIKDIFDKYNINNNIYQNMKRRMWMKWALNIGINQISALLNYTYKDMSNSYIVNLLFNIYDEVYEVSKAYNIGMTLEDIEELKKYTKSFSSDKVTSLTIDFNKDGLNELDEFGKTLIEYADLKNINVPYNKALYCLIKSKDINKKKEPRD